uniref:Uncharacterized protein n=1 Tax=Physcomitrium patens TaxID=3218 RepID=A0A2K1J0G8_PHYPA|nr:hypothetical protein PHYPA_022924 [Physcomitrium patens]
MGQGLLTLSLTTLIGMDPAQSPTALSPAAAWPRSRASYKWRHWPQQNTLLCFGRFLS